MRCSRRNFYGFDCGASAFADDLTTQKSPQEVKKFAVPNFGGIDVLVSNAGTEMQSGIAEMKETLLRNSFAQLFWTYFFIHFRLAQEIQKVFDPEIWSQMFF